MKKIILIFLILLFFGGFGMAQRTIKGTVKDKATDRGLFGATVQIKGTYEGVQIDTEDGSFELTVSEKYDSVVLLFSYPSYNNQEIPITQIPSVVDIIMEEKAIIYNNTIVINSNVDSTVKRDGGAVCYMIPKNYWQRREKKMKNELRHRFRKKISSH